MHSAAHPVAARRLAVALLLPLVLLLGAPLAHAGDPLAKAFKQVAKSEGKTLRGASKSALKTIKSALKDAGKAYKKGEQSAAAAVAAAVDVVTEQRVALEDAARAAAVDAAAAGALILLGDAEGEAPPPGPDFLAGTGGEWDALLADIEAELDKFDDKLGKLFDRFVVKLSKAAQKRDEPLSLHHRLPPHGRDFQGVHAPGAASEPALVEGDPKVEAPRQVQIAIVTRLLSATADDLLELGVSFGGEDLDVVVSGNTGGSSTVAELTGEPGARRVTMDDVGDLADAASAFLRVELVIQATLSVHGSEVLSAPRLMMLDKQQLAAVVKTAKASLKQESAFFGNVTGQVVKQLGQELKSHLKAVKKGDAGVDTALATGFCDLQQARGGIGFWRTITANASLSNIRGALDEVGVKDDFGIPDELNQDACGLYADFSARWYQREAKAQDKATRAFDKFLSKLLKLADKQGGIVGVSAISGRQERVALPLVTTLQGALDGFEVLVAPHLTDAYMLVEPGAGEADAQVHAELAGLAEGSGTSISTSVTLNDGQTLVLGGISAGSGGSGKQSVPGLTDVPFLGHLFRAGADSDSERSLLVLATPRILATE